MEIVRPHNTPPPSLWPCCINNTSPVHATHQSSTSNAPVQYIQHTSPVHTTYQSSTCNTSVQYTPVHTSHQSSTYNKPVKYMQHTSPVHTIHQSRHTKHQSSTSIYKCADSLSVRMCSFFESLAGPFSTLVGSCNSFLRCADSDGLTLSVFLFLLFN